MSEVEISNKILREVVEQTGKLFETVMFLGTNESTEFMANDEEGIFFLHGKFKKPIPELNGTFGINNFPLFNGLLRFPSYNTDEAKIYVTRQSKTINSKPLPETVTEFKFRDKFGKGTNYRTQYGQKIAEMELEVPTIPWDVSFVPDKSKINEFVELSKLFAMPAVSIYTQDNDIVISLGEDTDSTHYATMIFHSGVSGTIRKINYNTQKFLDVLRNVSNLPSEIKFTNRRIIGVFAESENVEYKYFLRSNV